MAATPYAAVNALLDTLLDGIRRALGERLVGLYLFGSLVSGDYDPGVSDVDLLAVVESDITEAEFARLDALHQQVIAATPQWDNHIEIAYLSRRALTTFRTERSQIGIISPGEPFHFKDAGADWLLNWWNVREQGVTLWGPQPETLIAPISHAEFLRAVRIQASDWREWVFNMRERNPQSYAILTLCRALYAHEHGTQASKRQAAAWAMARLPESAPLIQNALAWRAVSAGPEVDHAATFPETVRFIHSVIDIIELDAPRA